MYIFVIYISNDGFSWCIMIIKFCWRKTLMLLLH